MYSIHRFCRGRENLVLGNIVDLDEACEKALELQRREVDQAAEYLVMTSSHSTPRASKAKKQKQSVVLPRTDARPRFNSESRPNAAKSSAAQVGHAMTASDSMARTIHVAQQRMYSISRFVDGRFDSVLSGFRTLRDAQERAHELQRPETDAKVDYRVRDSANVATPDRQAMAPKRPRRSGQAKRRKGKAIVPRPINGQQRRPAKASSANERKRALPQVWGLTDRRGDISLAVRPEEELGLGIPAQWGKGRRNRKGDYIP